MSFDENLEDLWGLFQRLEMMIRYEMASKRRYALKAYHMREISVPWNVLQYRTVISRRVAPVASVEGGENRNGTQTETGIRGPVGGENRKRRAASHNDTTPTAATTMNSFHPGESSSHPFREPAPLPSSIPKVNEVGATSAPLKSAAFFLGAYCKEFNGGLDTLYIIWDHFILTKFYTKKCVAMQRTLCSARRRIETRLTV